MSIKVRILGGFVAILTLTACVAAVGWRSLTTYATGSQRTIAAQSLSSEIGRLALLALDDQSSQSDGARAAAEEVGRAIDRLSAAGEGDAGLTDSTAKLRDLLLAFTTQSVKVGEQRATSSAIQTAHQKVVADFQTLTRNIGAAQRSNLDISVHELTKSIAEQVELSSVSALASRSTKALAEVRLVQGGIETDPETFGKLERQVRLLSAILNRLTTTSFIRDEAADALDAVNRYATALARRAAPAAGETAETGRPPTSELEALGIYIRSALEKLDGQLINTAGAVRQHMQAAQDRMGNASELLALSSTATAAARDAQSAEQELVRTGDEANARAMDKAAETLLETVQSISYKLTLGMSTDAIASLTEQIRHYRASIPAMLQADRAERDLRRQIAGTVDALGAQARRSGDGELAAMDRRHSEAVWLLGGGVALALALGLALSLLIGRSITRPVLDLVASMSRLASGDLTVELPERTRRDEIGRMIGAVKTFKDAAVENVRIEAEISAHRRDAEHERSANEAARALVTAEQARVVDELAMGLERLSTGDLTFRLNRAFGPDHEKLRGDFNAAVDALQRAMLTIARSAGGIRTNTGEISQAAQDLFRRTEQQAASLEETAAALDEITATVNKTAAGAGDARGAASTAKDDAERSSGIVRRAIDAMDDIERSSSEISQIIGVIDEIAFQTNLLALNAGVEAARAGESGRGFAVVASEVRALAQRSAQAAKEIKALIQTSGEQVRTGVRLVDEAGQSLSRISGQVADISGYVSEIAASAAEQATGLGEVNAAVNQMDEATQQNAAMTEQSTAASTSLAMQAEELDELLGKFILESRVSGSDDALRVARGSTLTGPAVRPTVLGNAAFRATPANDEWEDF